MTETEKCKAIYDWLVENVEYDYDILETAHAKSNGDSYNYASWALEGVFDYGYSVCDGISKAFTVMARIEGIVCVRVTGDEHAWNKVRIGKTWYGIDATFANLGINSENGGTIAEGVSYSEFMFTDARKTEGGKTSDVYTDYVCNTEYEFYKNFTVTYNSKQINLVVADDNDSSNDEAEVDEIILCAYNLYKNEGSGTKIMVEIAISEADYENESNRSAFIYETQHGDAIKNKMTYKFTFAPSKIGDIYVYTIAYEIA